MEHSMAETQIPDPASALLPVPDGNQVVPDGLAALPSLRPLPTTAERAASVIRDNIFEGRFAPGTALPEAALAEALRVSRNTVREAFRMLTAEHLLSHEAHKGVVVRQLSAGDVRDIYYLRRVFELSAFELAIETLELAGIAAVVAEAQELAAAGRWREVGTANLRFHEVIVGIHRSARITEVFRRLMTELRLGFLAVEDPAAFHGAFLARNRAILEAMAAGRLGEARAELTGYFNDAESMVVKAVAGAAR
jgi:DNA-binding GntR family transcriptional regulator